MTSVAVVNQHTNNYGDDAAGVALVHEVVQRLGATHVDVFYIWHQRSGQGLPVAIPGVEHHFLDDLSGARDIRPRLALETVGRLLGRPAGRPDLRRLVEGCRAADVVLVSPAGSNIGIYKDWMYLLVLALLVLEGIRPVFVQNTIGPSSSPVFDAVARYVLRRSWLSVREQGSQRWLASHGMSAYLGVDTALLDHRAPAPNRGGAPYLALVPTRLANWHRDFRGRDEDRLWRDNLVDAVAGAAARNGLRVLVVPHLYGPQAEDRALESVTEALRVAGATAELAQVTSLDEYRSVLAGASVAVSMRYHGLILAGQHGVPCVALCYEAKMQEAAAYLGLAELALDVRWFTREELTERIDRATTRREELRARLVSRTPALREIALGPLLSLRSGQLRDVA